LSLFLPILGTMVRNANALPLVLLLLVGSASALADVYTWVDEQGNVHFSDTPPEGGAKQVAPPRSDTSPDAQATAQTNAEPIPYRGTVPSRRLALTEVRLDLPYRGPGKQRIGRRYRGYHCNSSAEDLLVDPSKKLKGSSPLPQDFHKRLAELAYQPPEFATTGRRKLTIAELTAVASVTELSLKTCFDRGRVGGVLLPRKNLVELTVHWEVHDRLTQERVFQGVTRGRFDRWETPYASTEEDQGTFTATRHALLSAGDQLLANPDFVTLLSPSAAPLAQASTAPAAADTAAIQPRRALSGSSFRASLPAVRAATAMIRTVRRNGHGFLLSADGYLLTNYRVVADGQQAMTAPVMVVFADESIPGTVIRSDRTRNVALVKLQRQPKTLPLPVAKSRIGIGETVYVVGGPLEETLSHTITEGVITAHRTLGGAGTPFYQTNAPVDRDNPTGPVFNDRGEVVALASGVVDSSGRRPGVYYLIPIDDALEALGINP
jgi:S1-C subfamily serine protease